MHCISILKVICSGEGDTSLVPDSLSQVGEENLVQSQLWATGDTGDSLVLIEEWLSGGSRGVIEYSTLSQL